MKMKIIKKKHNFGEQEKMIYFLLFVSDLFSLLCLLCVLVSVIFKEALSW